MWSPAKRKDGSELWWLDSPPFDVWSNHNPYFTLTNRPFLEHRGTSNHNISWHYKIGKNVQCSIQNPIANILKHFLAFPNSFVAKSCRYFICWEVFGDQLALVKNSSILLAFPCEIRLHNLMSELLSCSTKTNFLGLKSHGIFGGILPFTQLRWVKGLEAQEWAAVHSPPSPPETFSGTQGSPEEPCWLQKKNY